jgi:hypothetical protein
MNIVDNTFSLLQPFVYVLWAAILGQAQTVNQPSCGYPQGGLTQLHDFCFNTTLIFPENERVERLDILISFIGVCEGVAMDSLEFHLGPPCPTFLPPAGRQPLK